MNEQGFEIAVIGSGFAGSLMAMLTQRLGLSTVLVERGSHPRFAIGESSTPLANLLLEEISQAYDLPFVRPLCKWGTWQRELPQLTGGIKRGFTFYHHQLGKPFATGSARQNQLLVGASPNEAVADTHWYRPDFDHYLMAQAQSVGVTYLDETVLGSAKQEPTGMRLAGTRRGEETEIRADFVIDATGPRGFLHRALRLPEKPFTAFPHTQALFAHFQNVASLPQSFAASEPALPYPPEQAAVHHVFPGGWIWVLKFNNGITSAGVAATDAVAADFKFESGAPAWSRLLEQLPSLAESFQSARTTTPFTHSPRLSFQSEKVADSHWALLPSAAGFIDPLLSTGFPLTLLGVARIAELLKSSWQRSGFRKGLDDYAESTALELEITSRLVSSLYAAMDRFELFKELSLLYFAAASYSETARRLGKPHLANGFMLCRNPSFAAQVRMICEAVSGALSTDSISRLSQNIRKAIEPFDVAGLGDRSRDPWYPAKVSDLLQNAPKVGASEPEILKMLSRCGLNPN